MRFALVNFPCVVLAFESLARPSLVLGPVDAPPCSLQRPAGCFAGLWHGVPLRVFAPHLSPGQFTPNCHWIPFCRLLFVIFKTPPLIGFYSITFWLMEPGSGGMEVIIILSLCPWQPWVIYQKRIV